MGSHDIHYGWMLLTGTKLLAGLSVAAWECFPRPPIPALISGGCNDLFRREGIG